MLILCDSPTRCGLLRTNDLSFSLGYPEQMQYPEPIDAIEHGVARALAAGVAPGVLAPTVANFHRLRKMGVCYLPMVISGLIGIALRAAVAEPANQRKSISSGGE
jgi:2-keto-3-deoxy-L-rhamnonate aldolase RhmA